MILLLVSSIPAIAVFIWFRLARYPFSPPLFAFSLLAGAASFFPALFLQSVISPGSALFQFAGRWSVFAEIFLRIAFTEELSRLLVMIILVLAVRRFTLTTAGAAGLAAGLGFAILESAVYGASNPGSAMLRVFTAAPLHGACGYRVGASVMMFRESPARAVSRFLTAVVIHGVYNFMLTIPGRLPPLTAVLISLSALATSVLAIRSGMREE